MENAASPSMTTTRTAYIRSILDKDKQDKYHESCWLNIKCLLGMWVGQRVHFDPAGTGARRLRSSQPPNLHHHYILGQSNPVDAFVLDWFLDNSQPDSWRLSRHDFEVYLSEMQIKDPANKDLVSRLNHEGVKITVVTPSIPTDFETEDICDGVMLTLSDYVLETSLIRSSSCWVTTDALYRDSLRHGHPQRYNTEELAKKHYENRLKNKMGHTRRSCSYPHGKSDAWKQDHEEDWINYKCPSCGRRCKRSKGCKITGDDWAKNKDRIAWDEGVDTTAPRPPEFERDWRLLTAEDVCNGWGTDGMSYERFRKWKWRSVDTFTGE
ncbi:peptidase A1 [Fusarium beomiforme]|uniref:Peptidase A1 n=1 Tax=Fusarium beomiforme TaxID=44412 RepID=A0A9P5ACA3_9HYPO|nr:peptidase A1 [Fusarium beomiforme]